MDKSNQATINVIGSKLGENLVVEHLAIWTFEITKFNDCYRRCTSSKGGICINGEGRFDKDFLLRDELGNLIANPRVEGPRSTRSSGTKYKGKD